MGRDAQRAPVSGGFASRAERRKAAIEWIAQQFSEQRFDVPISLIQDRFGVSHVTAQAFRKEAEAKFTSEGGVMGQPILRPDGPTIATGQHAKAKRIKAKEAHKAAQDDAADDLPWDDDPTSGSTSGPPARREDSPRPRKGGGNGGQEGFTSYWSPSRPQKAKSRQELSEEDLRRPRSIVTAAQYERFLAAGMVRLGQVAEEVISDLDNVRQAAFHPSAMNEMGPVWLNNAMKALTDLPKAFAVLSGEVRAYGKELRALNKERFEHEGAERFADAVIQAVQEQLGDGAEAFLSRVDELCQQPSDEQPE